MDLLLTDYHEIWLDPSTAKMKSDGINNFEFSA
jgi:hypothetical protein